MKISIITVTKNSAETIAACIRSVHSQSWPDIEHIIIDGASTDNTLEIIHSTPNTIACIITELDMGIYDAINKGIMLSTGDIIGILNADDIFYDSKVIEKIAQAFLVNDCDCIYGNLVFSNQKGKIIRVLRSKPFTKGLFEISWTPAHPTFYCKRNMYEQYGGYKTDYKIAADVELMLRFFVFHKINAYFLDEFLVIMRHGGVSTQAFSSTYVITKEMRRAFKENNIPFNLPKYLFFKFLKIREYLHSFTYESAR
jgi:glycosyltransferase involved in cell wall biosynthesis